MKKLKKQPVWAVCPRFAQEIDEFEQTAKKLWFARFGQQKQEDSSGLGARQTGLGKPGFLGGFAPP